MKYYHYTAFCYLAFLLLGWLGIAPVAIAADEDKDYTEIVILGDLNNDGKVNAEDRLLLEELILGKKSAVSINTTAADINKDNAINVADLVLLVATINDSQKNPETSIDDNPQDAFAAPIRK